MQTVYEIYEVDGYGLLPSPYFTSESEQEARDYFRRITTRALDDVYCGDRYILRKKEFLITVLDDVSI